jgi:hypothetical protein
MSAVAVVQPETSMTWERLEASAQWTALTVKQKIWFVVFMGTGDALVATRAAFDCKSERNMKIMSYEARRHPALRSAIGFYCGRSERELFLEELQRTISRESGIAKTKSQALYARLAFGVESLEVSAGTSTTAADVPCKAKSDARVPAGATALADKSGVIRGYRTAEGKHVQLAAVEVGQ